MNKRSVTVRRLASAALAGGLLLLAQDAVAPVSALASGMDLTAAAAVGGPFPTEYLDPVTNSSTFAQAATLNPMSVAVSALATYQGGSVLATGQGSAYWTDAAHAHIDLATAYAMDTVIHGGAVVNSGGSNKADWSYGFA